MEVRKRIHVLLYCVAFFCLSISASPLVSPSGVGYEVIALMGIKDLLVDPNGVLSNWDQSSFEPCSWTMVTCSSDGLVIGLEVPSQNLSGTLAPTIGNLTNTQSVLLENNNISGDLPSELGSLTKLQILDLSNNKFSGQIPTTLSNLKNLQYLRLNNNNLSGEIPASLANLTHLHLIDLSFNNLSGQVPKFPATIIKTEGNPYVCNNGDEKAGCADMDTALLPSRSSSSNGKLNYPSLRIYKKSGILYVILIILSQLELVPITLNSGVPFVRKDMHMQPLLT